MMLKCTCKGLQKSIRELGGKIKPRALQHFKVDLVLNIDETFNKEAESKEAPVPPILLYSGAQDPTPPILKYCIIGAQAPMPHNIVF